MARFTPEEEALMSAYASGAPRADLEAQLASVYPEEQLSSMGSALGLAPPAGPMQRPPPGPPPPGLMGPQGPPAAPPAGPPGKLPPLGLAGPQGPPLPPGVTPAPMGPRAPAAPAPRRMAAARPAAPDGAPDLDAFLKQYGEPEEDYGVPGPEGSAPPTKGLLPSGEQRKLSTFKIDPLAREDLADMRGELTAAARDAQAGEEDSRAMTRWADRVGSQRKQEIEQEGVKQQVENTARYKSMLAKHTETAREIAENDITDPSVWSGDTGKDILSGIGMFMLGLMGGPQLLMPHIDKVLERGMQVQKEKIAKKRADWETEGLLLDRVAKIYDTEEAQAAAARAIAIQGVNEQIKRFSDFSQDPAVKARGKAAIVELEQQQLLAELALDQATRDEVMTSLSPPAPVKGGGGGGGLKGLVDDLKLEAEANKLLGRDPQNYVKSLGVYVTNPEERKAVNAVAESTDNAVQTANTMMALYKQNSTGGLAPAALDDVKRKFESEKTNLTMQLKGIWQLGVLSDSDMDMLNKVVPSMSITDRTLMTALQSVVENSRRGLRNKLQNTTFIAGDPPARLANVGDKPKSVAFTPEGG